MPFKNILDLPEQTPGTLDEGEPHPAAYNAMAYVKSIPVTELLKWEESFASNAIEGNRLAEVCGETLRRVMHGEPVSDRYLLGLAYTLKNMIECEE